MLHPAISSSWDNFRLSSVNLTLYQKNIFPLRSFTLSELARTKRQFITYAKERAIQVTPHSIPSLHPVLFFSVFPSPRSMSYCLFFLFFVLCLVCILSFDPCFLFAPSSFFPVSSVICLLYVSYGLLCLLSSVFCCCRVSSVAVLCLPSGFFCP